MVRSPALTKEAAVSSPLYLCFTRTWEVTWVFCSCSCQVWFNCDGFPSYPAWAYSQWTHILKQSKKDEFSLSHSFCLFKYFFIFDFPQRPVWPARAFFVFSKATLTKIHCAMCANTITWLAKTNGNQQENTQHNIWPFKANSRAGRQHCRASLEVQWNHVGAKRLNSFHGSRSDTASTNYFVCFRSHYKRYPAATGATCLRRRRRCIFNFCLLTNQQKRHRAESLSDAFPAPIKSFAHQPVGLKSCRVVKPSAAAAAAAADDSAALFFWMGKRPRWKLRCSFWKLQAVNFKVIRVLPHVEWQEKPRMVFHPEEKLQQIITYT